MSAPDLSEARQNAEAVAYGKLLAVREILDALAKARPEQHPRWSDLWNHPEEGRFRHAGRIAGYNQAVNIVKATRLGVEKR